MPHPEHCIPHDQEECLDPRHFYAAYVFQGAQERQEDIAAVVSQAQQMGYPVRYWWLSDALHLEDTPDRLIVCVHHASLNSEAGVDLYDALKEQDITWDFLEAASVGEYSAFGRIIEDVAAVHHPDGTPLFPPTKSQKQL